MLDQIIATLSEKDHISLNGVPLRPTEGLSALADALKMNTSVTSIDVQNNRSKPMVPAACRSVEGEYVGEQL
jgi:hypothetical protein